MSSWTRVRGLFEETLSAERRARQREHRALRARLGLQAWYERAECELMDALAAALETHAAELVQPRVAPGVGAPAVRVVSTQAGQSRRALQLVFLDAEVLVYSARGAQGPLMVHWARVFRAKRRNLPKLLSVPGFRVRRGAHGEMLLQALGPGAQNTPLCVEDVARRVLTMLVELAASRRRVARRETVPCTLFM